MENTLIILYLLVAVGLLWYFTRKKKKKTSNKLEELVLRQAHDLDEKNEIVIELYEKLYAQKDWIPNPENKDSEVANTS